MSSLAEKFTNGLKEVFAYSTAAIGMVVEGRAPSSGYEAGKNFADYVDNWVGSKQKPADKKI